MQIHVKLFPHRARGLWIISSFLPYLEIIAILSLPPDGDEDELKGILIYVGAFFRFSRERDIKHTPHILTLF